jgi:type III secretion protein T
MNEISALTQTINLYLMALALAIPRGYAMFSLMPVTTRLGLPELLRAALAIAITIPILDPLAAELKKLESFSELFIVFLCLKEAFLGLVLGVVLGFPFWVLEISGNMLDFVRQAPDAQLQDPQGTTESSITGTLLVVFIVFIFIVTGGLRIISDVIYTSYEAWPILKVLPELKLEELPKFLALFDKMMRSAFVLAAPLLLIVVLAFLILIMTARFVPQINVFDLSMSFRNVAFFAVLPIYLIYVVDYAMPELGATRTVVEAVRGFMHE